MLSQTTILKLADIIKVIADVEAQVEETRIALCEKPTFEPYSAFQRISNLASVITHQRLSDFLADNDIHITKEESCHLIRLFDVEGYGKLSYTEFLHAVLPRTDANLGKQIISRKNKDQDIPFQIEKALAKIFETELLAYKEIQALKHELNVCEDFSVMEAFKEIDAEEHGYIDASKIYRFMERAELPLSGSQIDDFLTRTVKNEDGVMRYPEFITTFYQEQAPTKKITWPTQSPSSNRLASPTLSSKSQTINFTYSSPKKQFLSPADRLNAESFYSPVSTKASNANNTSLYKTPTRKSATKSFCEEELGNVSVFQPPPGSYYTVNMGPRVDTPMKTKEENELVKALAEILEHIHIIENVKNELAMKEDFNIHNAFVVFDYENNGAINARQLEEGFENVGLHVTKGEVGLLMKRLDQDNDGLVRYEDFSRAITPKSAEFVKLLYSRQPRYRNEFNDGKEAFCEETLAAYKTFLQTLVEEEVLWESTRQRLVKRKTFNLHDAYKALDRYDNGYITAEQFRDLLEERHIFFSQKDVNTLVERYAKAVRGKISYYDFVREMTPKSVEKYAH